MSNYSNFILQNNDRQKPILFADNCPREPVMTLRSTFLNLQSFKSDKIPANCFHHHDYSEINNSSKNNKFNQTKTKMYASKFVEGNLNCFNNSSIHSYQKKEHAREIKSMRKRIKDCKNLQQRKKDHNDPMVYPVYFMRDSEHQNEIKINHYCQQVIKNQSNMKHNPQQISMNKRVRRKKMSCNQKKIEQTTNLHEKLNNFYDNDNLSTYLPSPNFHKAQKITKKNIKDPNNKKKSLNNIIESTNSLKIMDKNKIENKNQQGNEKINTYIKNNYLEFQNNKTVFSSQFQTINLPNCSVIGIIEHIIHKKLYQKSSLSILYARLLHFYDKKIVENNWNQVMYMMNNRMEQIKKKKNINIKSNDLQNNSLN